MPPVQKSGEVSAGRVCVGRITGAHGLKGELSVRSFTAEAGDVAAYGPVTIEPGGRRLTIHVVGRKKLDLIVRAEGVADRTTAEALRGCDLYVARTALPPPAEDEFYHADLIGLDALFGGPDARTGDGAPGAGNGAGGPDAGTGEGSPDAGTGEAAPVAGTGDGGRLGRIVAVHEFGAAPVLELMCDDGRTVLVPFTREAVPVVDVAGGMVRVASLPGLLEGEPA